VKQEVFGMRRANGAWFVLDIGGHARVLVFRSLMGAWRARAKNDQLMLYWPSPVDAGALAQFATLDDGHPTSFWLVDEDEPDAILDRGHPLEYVQLCTLERLSDLPLNSPLRITKGGRVMTCEEIRTYLSALSIEQ
jgi:hypothetical protein